MNAAKNTISGDDVWALVSSSSIIVIANGKQVVTYNPKTDDRAEIVEKISGRTGNLRAPALRIGDSFYIGFNEKLYEQIGEL